MKIVAATRNPGKLRELRRLTADLPIEWLTSADFPGAPDVVEDGATFEANALKKARALAAFTSHAALADDSGIMVDALGGRPGVLSARYAGEPADDDANNRRLIEELRDVPAERRTARYVCALALVAPTGEVTVTATCEGSIAFAPRGTNGFGYDPYFLVPGTKKTMAELADAEKDAISHRGKALRTLLPALKQLVRAGGR